MSIKVNIIIKIILTSAFRVLVKNPVKDSFYEKIIKKVINVLTNFLFFIKMMSKLSLIEFLISALRTLISISLIIMYIFF